MIKVIKFSADWCKPCKTLAPIYNEVKSELRDKPIEFLEIDVDQDNDDLVTKYNIRNVPTILILRDGSIVDRIVGTPDKTKLLNSINNWI